MGNLSINYSFWYILLCVLLGIAFAIIGYYRDRQFEDISNFIHLSMAILRGTVVTLCCFFLLNPLLKSNKTETKNPIIIVGTDQSESISTFTDSSILKIYENGISGLADALGNEYQIETISFGDAIHKQSEFIYKEKLSNISSFLEYADHNYDGQNIGAIILASDGIYNEGLNPLYQKIHNIAPIYTIGLGDTSIRKDIAIKRVYHNNIAYLNDKFIIQVDWAAKNAQNSNSSISLYHIDGNERSLLETKPVDIDENAYFNTHDFVIDANKTGIQRFLVTISSIEGEESTSNNYKNFFIDILDARQKILIYAHAAHPDISALKRTISQNENFEIELKFAHESDFEVNDYDLVILHQLPSTKYDISGILNKLDRSKIARFFVLGEKSNLNRLNEIQNLLDIQAQQGKPNEVTAVVPPNFSLFTLDEEFRGKVQKLPPLSAPFGEYTVSPAGQVFMYQKIGNIQTGFPLLVFGESEGIKTGILSAEGIWSWQLFDYLQRENHDFVKSILSKSIQYLSIKEDKRKFKVLTAKNIFKENEPIIFDGELYNNSYELINTPEVSLNIKNEEDQEFEFVLNRVQNFYSLNAGFFPEGNYTYQAQTNFNNELLNHYGKFSVQALDFELSEPTANHNLLKSLANSRNGSFYLPNEIDKLITALKSNNNVKPVLYQSVQNRSLIHLKWPFFLIFILLSAEWFLRRYYGNY